MKLLTHVLLPVLIFPSLTVAAFYFIFHQSLSQTGLDLKIADICDPNPVPHPYRLQYTNIPSADNVLCGMVAFFHILIDPVYNPLLAVLFPTAGVVGLILFLEAARNRRPFALRMPTAVGLLIQFVSVGIVMPIYVLFFIVTGTASVRPSINQTPTPPSEINQGNAEALLFGLILGYVVPTAFMIFLVRPILTAIWQGIPILFALAIFAHKIIRPPSRYVQSGHPTVVATLVFTFLLCALLHMVYVWPILSDTAAFKAMFVPDVHTLDPAAASLAYGALELIKWDMIFGFGSTILATFWMADSVVSLVGILAWYAVASIAFGPAAAITGVFLWRERRLNGQSQMKRVTQKSK